MMLTSAEAQRYNEQFSTYRIRPVVVNFQPVHIDRIELTTPQQEPDNTAAWIGLATVVAPFVPDILKWFRRR